MVLATAPPQLKDSYGTSSAESLGICEAARVLAADSATSARVKERSPSAASLVLTPVWEA